MTAMFFRHFGVSFMPPPLSLLFIYFQILGNNGTLASLMQIKANLRSTWWNLPTSEGKNVRICREEKFSHSQVIGCPLKWTGGKCSRPYLSSSDYYIRLSRFKIPVYSCDLSPVSPSLLLVGRFTFHGLSGLHLFQLKKKKTLHAQWRLFSLLPLFEMALFNTSMKLLWFQHTHECGLIGGKNPELKTPIN